MSKYQNVMMGVCVVFAAMLILCSAQAQNKAETVSYGANPAAGHFLRVDDVNIYYETYGSGGTPLVMLRGGLYGYIEEFGELIGELSKHRRVIAIATRGHGKSDIGTKPFSYVLFADDAFAVIRHETSEKVDVFGFSDGAVTSYTLASAHPELIRRLVAIGGPRKFADWTPSAQAEFRNAKPSDVERDSPQFVSDRKKLMPQPERWLEFNEKTQCDVGRSGLRDRRADSIDQNSDSDRCGRSRSLQPDPEVCRAVPAIAQRRIGNHSRLRPCGA